MMKILLLITLYITHSNAYNFSKVEHFLFEKPDDGMVTEASVIWHKGEKVYEKFETGDENTLHLLWSMSKSIGSLLFGIAQDKGYINKDEKIKKYFPQIINKMTGVMKQHYEKLTLAHFLHMSSGLDWNEFYESDPFRSHVVNMLYDKSKDSMAEYVLATPPRYAPGERFYYSSGDTNVFMAAIKSALPAELKFTYPWQWFFDPMEMEAIFEQDGSGTFVGSSYVYLKTKDLLKLGQLILNKGKYKGKQIVSQEYINYMISLSPYQRDGRCLEDHYMTYGAQVWLNHKCPNGKIPLEGIPDDLIMFLGHGGQSIFVIPSLELVAVRIARDTKDKALEKIKYTKMLMEALNE
jgi:CubicO group peptidase (beta-lactamase class C family)